MNIAFGGMESYTDNNRITRRTLDKYFNAERLILFDPKPVKNADRTIDGGREKWLMAESIREEEQRMIIGSWILGAIGIGVAVVSLAA